MDDIVEKVAKAIEAAFSKEMEDCKPELIDGTAIARAAIDAYDTVCWATMTQQKAEIERLSGLVHGMQQLDPDIKAALDAQK